MRISLFALAFTILHLTAPAQPMSEKELQALFVLAEDNAVVELPAGVFRLDQSLWLDEKKNVTIRGQGIDKTILNFAGQISGAEGIKVTNSRNIRIEHLTVQDTKGDGIKAQEVDGIVFYNVKAEWTRGAHEKNGGYGLYPVQCSKVIIDSCMARGASDAGIYVGQSRHIIVRNSRAWENVAGIEIENSLYADVYQNAAYNNTGGILVFDLPDLTLKQGGYVKVFNNQVRDNNHTNFAPKGNIVGKVPLGTGIMVMATNHVEIFRNQIRNNRTVGTAVVSYYISENPITDTAYYPYPDQVSIYDNLYERPNVRATGKGRLGKLYRFKLRFGKKVPHIIYDGIVDPKKPGQLCIRNNQNQTFANIDAEHGFRNVSRDASKHDCSLPAWEVADKNFQQP